MTSHLSRQFTHWLRLNIFGKKEKQGAGARHSLNEENVQTDFSFKASERALSWSLISRTNKKCLFAAYRRFLHTLTHQTDSLLSASRHVQTYAEEPSRVFSGRGARAPLVFTPPTITRLGLERSLPLLICCTSRHHRGTSSCTRRAPFVRFGSCVGERRNVWADVMKRDVCVRGRCVVVGAPWRGPLVRAGRRNRG